MCGVSNISIRFLRFENVNVFYIGMLYVFFTIKPARLSLCYVYIRFIREGMMSKEGPIDSNEMIF